MKLIFKNAAWKISIWLIFSEFTYLYQLFQSLSNVMILSNFYSVELMMISTEWLIKLLVKQGQILTSVILLELVLGNFHIFLRIDGFNFSHKVVRTNFVFFKIKFLFMKTIQIMKKIIKKISVNF